MAKMPKRRYKIYRYPALGKYIDTPTKAELKVIYYVDGIGDYRCKFGNLPEVILKGCRFQVKISDVNRKKKFSKAIKPFLDFSSGWRTLDVPQQIEAPLLFGLLKLRKGKQRKFVLIQSADQYFKSKIINIMAVMIDNLLYLDLVNRTKKKKP